MPESNSFKKALWPGCNAVYGYKMTKFSGKDYSQDSHYGHQSNPTVSRCSYCHTRTIHPYNNCPNCGANSYEDIAT